MVKRIFKRIPLLRREITAGDIMTRKPVTVDSNSTAQKIAKLMTDKRVGTVVVVKGQKPIGIVTDTDLTKRVVAPSKDPKRLKARDVMSTPLLFASPENKVDDVVLKMKKHRVKRIPIISKGRLVGIVTTTDIARNTPAMMDLLEARLLMRNEQPTFTEGETSGICETCGNYSEELTFSNEQWICNECREEQE